MAKAVYKHPYSKTGFSRSCLASSASTSTRANHSFARPAMTRVSIGLPPLTNLVRYLNQTSEDFDICCKVWEDITIPPRLTKPPMASEPGSRTHTFSMRMPSCEDVASRTYRRRSLGRVARGDRCNKRPSMRSSTFAQCGFRPGHLDHSVVRVPASRHDQERLFDRDGVAEVLKPHPHRRIDRLTL